MSSLYSWLSPKSYVQGNSAEHFKTASVDLNAAGSHTYEAASHAASAAINATGVAAQAVIGFGLYKYVAGEVIGWNAIAQGASSLASYVAPAKFLTGVLNFAAKASSYTAHAFANAPLITLAVTEVVNFALNPEYIINTAKGVVNTVLETAQVGLCVGDAVMQTAIGAALYMEEQCDIYNSANAYKGGFDALERMTCGEFAGDFVAMGG